MSLHAAPENQYKEQQVASLDGILGDGFGWIGCPANDNLYMMEMVTYGSTLVGPTVVDPCTGDFLNGNANTMYVAGNWGSTLYEVDVATGAGTVIAPFSGAPYDVSGMAVDRGTGIVYVCGTNISASYIGTLDVNTGVITQIGGSISNAPGLIDMAIDGSGTLFAWCLVNDNTYTIDKTTGVATLLGSLGYNANYGQGGNWNSVDGIIYLTAYNSATGPELRVMDPVTGSTTYIGALPGGQCAAFGFPGSGGGVGSWLTLDWYSGTVAPMGGLDNVPTNFDASGTLPGEVYTADLVFTSMDPDVGSSTIPCTMIIAGDPLVPPTNLVVTVVDEINGTVELTWDWTADAFQFFIIKRDGTPIGTSTTNSYIDNLPDYGVYCYTVQAFYDEGTTVPAGPECVEWSIPAIYINPDFHEAWVWVDATYQWVTTISSVGIGTLQYEFPDYVTDAFDCQHEVKMWDSYGDGWNGGTLTVYVNGSIVLNAITMAGSGPVSAYFMAFHGDEITTTFVCGGWCYECSYEIYDGFGNAIGNDGMGGSTPTGIGPGTCFAACPVPSYIVDVVPATGIIPQGGSHEVTIYWDAAGFGPGDYPEDLKCASNDPVDSVVYIGNLMHVYTPAQFAGTVTDCESGVPIPGVTVTAGAWQTLTDNSGDYSLYVDEGTYVVYFEKLSFESVNVPDTFALAGVITPLDIEMCEAPYPVPWVLATVHYPDEDYCDVEWGFPQGPYEILYDDGSAEDLFVWSSAGNENAVKFTPAGYPATVIGGRVFVGDGLFPAGSWMGTEFAIKVYDDDGTDGLPGTMLDSIGVLVSNYGWISFWGLDVTLDDGEFYISMLQLTSSPNAAPIGIDEEAPIAFRSYSRMGGTDWSLSVYQDFMLRAFVDGPQTDMIAEEGKTVYPPKVSYEDAQEFFSTANNTGFVTVPGTVKGGEIRNIEGFENPSEAVDYFVLARMSDFDPIAGPATGTMTTLSNETGLTYVDNDFNGLPMGWYAYAIQAVYSSGLMSPWVYSNVVGRDMDVEITFEITLCDGNDPIDVEISLFGQDWPYAEYFGVTDITGIYVFEQVWKGVYDY
jgi:hypothetical protein